jgi:predicted nuclease with RNAse H fold
MSREQPNAVWIGVDPGGTRAFGLAMLSTSGEVTPFCKSCVDLVTSRPLGVGVDAPLWWSSGPSSDRKADQWIRRTHRIHSGTVQTANSLRGAALVQGAMFVSRLREKFPGVSVTEAHPKALAIALGGWNGPAIAKLGVIFPSGEHERDATMAAIAAREGYEGRWTRDLSLERHPSEQDPKSYWLGPVSYFWPPTECTPRYENRSII